MPITGFEPESSVNCATTTVLTIKMFQRELKLREAEVQKLLEEKDEEGRLAREELELRVQALTNGDESKSKLLRDLELRLQSAVADGAKFKSATESLNMKECQIKRLEEEVRDLKKVSGNLTTLENSVSNLLLEKKQLEDKLFETESELSRICEESKNEMASQVEALTAELNELRSLNCKRLTTIETLTAANNERQSNLGNLNVQLEHISTELKEKNKIIETLKRDYHVNLDQVRNGLISKSAEQQKVFDSQMSTLREDHKTVLAKFSQKLKDAKVKEKADKITIESLRTDVVEGQNAIENLNKKLVEISLQVNEKEESLSKLREEHQAG